MGGISIWHWLILLIITLLWVIPLGQISRRIGWSPWLGLLGFIPLAGVILLWAIALGPWPIERKIDRI